jgi:hypothetical protein
VSRTRSGRARTTYTHDQAGELTRIDRPGTTADWYLTYDSWGLLRGASRSSSGTPTVVYAVDALDRVVSRTTSSTTTSTTLRGITEEVVATKVGNGTPVYYAHTPGGPLALRTGTQLLAPADAVLAFADGDVLTAAEPQVASAGNGYGSVIAFPHGDGGTVQRGEVTLSAETWEGIRAAPAVDVPGS